MRQLLHSISTWTIRTVRGIVMSRVTSQADHPLLVGAVVKWRRKKTWHMTQLTFSSNFYWKICFKFCILEQIIATVLFICISSINNKRSLLRFQSTTALTNRGWSACGDMWSHTFTVFRSARTRLNLSDRKKCFIKHRIWHVLTQMLI